MHTKQLVPVALLGAWLTALSTQADEAGYRLRLTATTAVTVTLPAAPSLAKGKHYYRDAAGAWVALAGLTAGAGTVTFTLDPGLLPAGGTTVVLDKPDDLDLADTTPPRLVRARLDGHDVVWPPPGLDLGWVDLAPTSFELHLADDQSPIRPASLSVALNGKAVPPGAPGLRFAVAAGEARTAVLSGDFEALLGEARQGTVRVAIACDDNAIDERRFETQLTFTASARPTIVLSATTASAADGTKVAVDSAFAGYENALCLVDGAQQTPGSSTHGVTWASAETSADHWACLLLPAVRRVKGVEIAWANYNSTFWTSARYDLMTWDGSQWQRALRVPQNPEAATSRHEYAPRVTDRVLLWVPAGGNHPRRPDMTWITEIRPLE